MVLGVQRWLVAMVTEQIIATSAEVTPQGGLVRVSHQSPRHSGLGIIQKAQMFSKVFLVWVSPVINGGRFTPSTNHLLSGIIL